MFERYTEKARRVIFFARYEASQQKDSVIRPEHILLALYREDKPLIGRFFGSDARSWRNLTLEWCERNSDRAGASPDPPLSLPSKRALAYAAEESEKRSSATIECVDLLLGLAQESDHNKTFRVLSEYGFSYRFCLEF